MDSNKTIILPRPGRKKAAPGGVPPSAKIPDSINPSNPSPNLRSPESFGKLDPIARNQQKKPAIDSFRNVGPSIRQDESTDNSSLKGGSKADVLFEDEVLPILMIAGKLKFTTEYTESSLLYQRMTKRIQKIRNSAEILDMSSEEAEHVSYILCSVIDESVLNTPWASESPWAKESLLLKLHHDTRGGEKFFDIISQLNDGSIISPKLQLLCYYALNCGFKGKMSFDPSGDLVIEQLKELLFTKIKSKQPERLPLSPEFEPVETCEKKSAKLIPLHLYFSILGTILLVSFLLFSLRINSNSKPFEDLASQTYRLDKKSSKHDLAVRDRLSRVLAVEIDEKRVTLTIEKSKGVTIRIAASELFGDKLAELNSNAKKLLHRVALAISDLPGYIVVSGHTDNQQIATIKFPSNWHLSLARAQATALELGSKRNIQNRIKAIPKGDSEPIASNDSMDGRAKNRRVDITLTHSYIPANTTEPRLKGDERR